MLLALLVLASLPLLWFVYAQPGGPRSVGGETVRRAVRPATAAGPGLPAYGGGLASGGRCDDLKVLVDRTHALPREYVPDDLVSLPGLGVPTLGGDTSLRRGAAESLARLVSAAAAAGEELVVISAYRSYEDQDFSYARLVSIYGSDVGRTSAPPGHSQHQLGTAVDFTNGVVGYEVHRHFGLTTASQWLQANAHEYGFVLAYPRGEETETGYRWEPWHYRYVGADNARHIEQRETDLHGFLEQEGVTGCRE